MESLTLPIGKGLELTRFARRLTRTVRLRPALPRENFEGSHLRLFNHANLHCTAAESGVAYRWPDRVRANNEHRHPLMSSNRPKLAAVVTTYFKFSHGENIVDRYLYGYGWHGTHHHPPMDIVSLDVDQVGEGDISRDRGRDSRR